MGLEDTFSTSANHNRNDTRNTLPPQHVGDAPNTEVSSQDLGQQAVERALESKLKELSTAITAQFKKALNTMTEEVNRLKKIAESLESGPSQVPTRSLKAVFPKIVITLGESDLPKMSNLGSEKILERLGLLGNPYNQITFVRVLDIKSELHLFTQSRPAYKQLIKDKEIVTLMAQLDLVPYHSRRKPEIFWVRLNEHWLPYDYLKNCREHLETMRRDTGLNISDVKFTQQRFLWGFEDSEEAIKACQQPLFFSGDYALAMPYDTRATPVFCLRCGGPGHTQDETNCPKRGLSSENWPCLICSGKHSGKEVNPLCPNRGKKCLFRCLNCETAGLDGPNHRTDSPDCPAPSTVFYREKWRKFTNMLPEWANGATFPSTDELRVAVEKGTLQKRPGKTKNNTNVDSLGQAEGPGAGPDTQILNRKGLMKRKKGPEPSPEGQAIESDDDGVVEFEATQTTTTDCSNPSLSQPTIIDEPSRKAGYGKQDLSILNWAKPIGGTTKSSLNTPSSSRLSTDIISPAHESNVIPKRKVGRPKGSKNKKRARAESVSSFQSSPSKRRMEFFNDKVPSSSVEPVNSSVEPVNSPVQFTDISQPAQSDDGNHDSSSDDPGQESDYETASAGGSEDEDD